MVKMYAIKSKILLINIIALVATNINSIKINTVQLSAGHIIDINHLNYVSTEVYDDILHGYYASHTIQIENFTNSENIFIDTNVCLKFNSLASYYYPRININGERFDVSKIFNDTNQYNLFDIDTDFINDKYSYGVIKFCCILQKQKLLIEVMDETNLPFVSNQINYKLLLDKTAVLRLRQKNQTHYISAITTGECYLQAFVNVIELCDQDNNQLPVTANITNFIASSRYKSLIKIASGHYDRERQINNYMNIVVKESLLHLTYSTSRTSFYDRYKPFESDAIELNLVALFELPERLPSLSITNGKFLTDIVPGDVINVNDLRNLDSLITTDNILVDVPDRKTAPFSHYNFTDCHAFNKNDAVKIEVVPYNLYSNHSTESFYKFDVLDEIVKQKNYGVDPKYLNNRYKCLKVKICSEFKRTKLIIPSVDVVNLDINAPNKSMIFDSQNVVLRYALGNETHYVARTEKGNCLFQALIYPNFDNSSNHRYIQSPLLYRGKILSANNDNNLEKWAEEFINNLQIQNYKTLMEVTNNPIVASTFYSKFSDSSVAHTLMNIYLDILD